MVPDDMAALEKHKFDIVYSRLLFSYLPDPALAMARVKDLLWPGGRILGERGGGVKEGEESRADSCLAFRSRRRGLQRCLLLPTQRGL